MRQSFTLIELLVVVAIIAVLVSILLPALNSARANAQSVVCKSNLRQIGLALSLYSEDYGGHIPQAAVLRRGGGLPTIYWFNVLEKYTGIAKHQGNNINEGLFQCPSRDVFDPNIGWGVGWGTQIDRVEDTQSLIIGDNQDIPGSQIIYLMGVSCPDDTKVAARHNGGGNYLALDGHVDWLSLYEVFANRDVPNKGTSSAWSPYYSNVVNHRFTSDLDG